MDKRIRNEIRQRGEQLGAWCRSGCQFDGIGTGISVAYKMIEFKGDIPRGTGNDISNLSAIIALTKYERSDQPMIESTLRLLEQCAQVDSAGVNLWIAHYCISGTQSEKATAAGIALRTYQTTLEKAERVLAGVLVANRRAA